MNRRLISVLCKCKVLSSNSSHSPQEEEKKGRKEGRKEGRKKGRKKEGSNPRHSPEGRKK
jgi:predicted transposase YdaD